MSKEETTKILYGAAAQAELEKALVEEGEALKGNASINLTISNGMIQKSEEQRHTELCQKLDTLTTLLVKLISAVQSLSSSTSASDKGGVLKG